MHYPDTGPFDRTGREDERLVPLGESGLGLAWRRGAPAVLTGIAEFDLVGREDVPLIEMFSASEQRARTSTSLIRTAIGGRLRVEEVRATRSNGHVSVVQRDARTGLQVTTVLQSYAGVRAIRVASRRRSRTGAATRSC